MKYYFRFIVYLFVVIGFSSSHSGAYDDFFQALDRDDAAAVQQLLGRGFDPNAHDEKGQLVLYRALRA